MSTSPPPAPGIAPLALSDPAVRPYLFLCLGALVVILLVQIEEELGMSSLLLVLVGVLGVLSRLRAGPVLFLVVLAGQQLVQHLAWSGYGRPRFGPGWALNPADVALCGAVLAYAVAHYRLQGLSHSVVPVDPRRREGAGRWHFWPWLSQPPPVPERRSPRLVSAAEVGLLLLTLPAAALAAQVCWAPLSRPGQILGLPARMWRVIVPLWVVAAGIFVVAAVLRQWQRRQMSREEATLLLQDVLWQETRREQRRLNRWLAWARLRRRRKERS